MKLFHAVAAVLSAPFLVPFKVYYSGMGEHSREIGLNKKISLNLRDAVFWTLRNLNTY